MTETPTPTVTPTPTATPIPTPSAVDDAYTALGNVQITIPAGGTGGANDLLANDTLPPSTGTTLTGFGPFTGVESAPGVEGASAQGGTVTVNADGSFSYLPPPGFEGADSFAYTLTNSAGSDTATVTITVSGMIWFVDVAAPPGGDGRLGGTTPFNCLVGPGCFSAVAADQTGDTIFLFSGSYTGGLTLLNDQRLIGQGASASLATITGLTPPPGSLPLPDTGGVNPVITTIAPNTDGLRLGQDNLLRGFTIGDTTGADIAGTAFGTLTVSEVSLTGTGQTLALATGTLAATFAELSSTGSSGPALSLSSVGGTLSNTVASSLSGAAGTTVQVSGGTATVTYQGSVSQTSGLVVEVANTTGGAVTFAGGTVTSTGGTGISISGAASPVTIAAADLSGSATITIANTSGTVTVTDLMMTHTAGAANAIDIAGGAGTVSLTADATSGIQSTTNRVVDITGRTGGTITLSGGPVLATGSSLGINVGGATAANAIQFTGPVDLGTSGSRLTGGTALTVNNNGQAGATISFTDLDVFTSGQVGIDASGSGTLNVTTGRVDTTGTGATGVRLLGLAASLTFSSVTVAGVGASVVAVDVEGVTGSVIANGGAISGTAATGLRVVGGSANVTYAGPISGATRAVEVRNRTGGAVTVSGAITNSGTGILVQDNTGGSAKTVTFSGASVALSTGANAAVTLSNNAGTTINFTGGGLAITTTSGAGFSATGGGTVTVQGSGNTIASGSGTALNVANTTIGASGLTFRSIAANGAPNGIVLNNSGSSGGLTVTGTGTAGTGGTIQNTSGDGIALTNANNVALSFITVNTTGAHGINVSGGSGLALTGTQVTNAGNGDNEHGLNIANLTGAATLSGVTFTGASEDLVHVETTGALTFTVSNSSQFSYPAAIGAFAGNAILLIPNGGGAISASIQNATFTNIRGVSAQIGAGTLNANGAQSLTFSNNTVNVTLAGRAGGVVVSGQELTTTAVTIANNTFNGAGGNGVVGIDVNDGSTVTGTVSNNQISNPPGNGMFLAVDENALATVAITGNTVTNAGIDGIQVVNFAGVGESRLNATITNNQVNGHSQNASLAFVGGISVTIFGDSAGDVSRVTLRGNTVTGTPTGATQCGGAPCVAYYLDESALTNPILEEVPDTVATGAATVAYVQSINNPAVASVSLFGTFLLSNGVATPGP
jgi:hypothetical protein